MFLGQLAEDCLITDSIRLEFTIGESEARVSMTKLRPIGKFRNRNLIAICFHGGAR
jgi:hypothetical protein